MSKCRPCTYAKNRQRNASVAARCQFEGCENAQHSRGYCSTHHKHLRASGVLERVREQPFKELPTYNGMHQRLRLVKGYASKHSCIECGGQAQDWALDVSKASVIYEGENNRGRLSTYSTDLDAYLPMCHGCHLRRDRAKA